MFRRNVLTSSPQGNYLINCHFDVLNGIPMDRGDVSQTLICTVGAICSLASSDLMYQTQKCLHIHVNITDNKRTLQKLPSSFFPLPNVSSLIHQRYGLKKPVSYWAVRTSSCFNSTRSTQGFRCGKTQMVSKSSQVFPLAMNEVSGRLFPFWLI